MTKSLNCRNWTKKHFDERQNKLVSELSAIYNIDLKIHKKTKNTVEEITNEDSISTDDSIDFSINIDTIQKKLLLSWVKNELKESNNTTSNFLPSTKVDSQIQSKIEKNKPQVEGTPKKKKIK